MAEHPVLSVLYMLVIRVQLQEVTTVTMPTEKTMNQRESSELSMRSTPKQDDHGEYDEDGARDRFVLEAQETEPDEERQEAHPDPLKERPLVRHELPRLDPRRDGHILLDLPFWELLQTEPFLSFPGELDLHQGLHGGDPGRNAVDPRLDY